jgi:cytochrome c oxidase cbb3-type subunit 4
MDWGNLWGLYTLLMVVVFIGIAVWAWSGKRARAFRDAAEIPLKDDGPDTRRGPAGSKETSHE